MFKTLFNRNILDQYQLFEIANFLQHQYEHQKKKNIIQKWMKKYSLMLRDSLIYQLNVDRIMKSIGRCLTDSKTDRLVIAGRNRCTAVYIQ